MSYFVGTFKSDAGTCDSLETILVDVLPDHVKNDAFRKNSGSSCISVFGNKKVIENIVLCDDKQGSWMAVIGTPLCRLESERQKQGFLLDFLNSPSEALRDRLDGNFAVLAYDDTRDSIIAATDLNNTTPIFYAATPKGVLFSSHELPLAKFMTAEIDPFGFAQLMHVGVTWDSYTRFRNIYKMLPAEIAVIDSNKKLHRDRYWHPKDEPIWSGTFDEDIEKWIALLKNAVWKYYECSDFKPVITDCTAGEDTRLIIALCHALKIPFTAHVTGLPDSTDVIVAKEAAVKAGFDLIERSKHWMTEEQLLQKVLDITLESDGYQGLFAACVEYATDTAEPLNDYSIVKYCGLPGGEAFRGSYYLRGKAFFPSRKSMLDYVFFTKMKYLLDFYPGLLKYGDDDFIRRIHETVKDNLDDVKEFPVGIQIDHMLRVFQTCCAGLKYKNPLYLPFATNQMTRSIYSIPAQFKRGGKLSKACTEILFPELAVVKTQNKVPTIRKTIVRTPLFLPEHISVVKKVASGAVSRLFKWKQANKWYFSHDLNAYVFTTLLNTPPYCDWLSSSESMITGHLYNPDVVNLLLAQAKTGVCRYVPILGRLISQELAVRWVRGEETR